MNGSSLNICIKIDDNVIYEFKGTIDHSKMVKTAEYIENLLKKRCLNKDKTKSVFELFVETIQNILTYSYKNPENHGVNCHFSLSYFTEKDLYLFESCNLIEKSQKEIIEDKLNKIQGLNDKELRKLIRQKSRTKEDKHNHGAGLGYLMMARKTSKPIEVMFAPFDDELIVYKQKLYI